MEYEYSRNPREAAAKGVSDQRVRRRGVAELTVLAQKPSVVAQKECCHDGWVVNFKGTARRKQQTLSPQNS